MSHHRPARKGRERVRHDQTSAMPAPAQRWIPHLRTGLFRRAGVVEHLFGEVDPLSVAQSPYELHPFRHALPAVSRVVSIEAPKAQMTQVTVIDKCGQALKGVWWMSWHREAKKDVVACDKLREAGKQALIRRCPNRETGLV